MILFSFSIISYYLFIYYFECRLIFEFYEFIYRNEFKVLIWEYPNKLTFEWVDLLENDLNNPYSIARVK